MKTRPVKTTYLSMAQPPERKLKTAPREDLLLLQAHSPTSSFYRFLYQEVGQDLFWVDRGFMSDKELQGELQDPAMSLYVLYVAGVPAGYFELYAEADHSIRLAYFGLMPEFRGQRLGGWLLERAIETAWQKAPSRFWLHTCELDSPAALPTYLQAGFEITHLEIIEQRLPES